MSKVPTTPTLLAPGAKLSDFTNIVFSAYAGNGAMSSRGWGQSYFTHPYLDADGNLQFVVTTVQKYDDKYIKGVTVKLTQGADGVYGEQLATPYIQTEQKNFVPENVVSWTLESPAYSRRFKTSVRATGLFVMPTALTIYIR